MISYINGIIKQINDISFIIECNDIGYLCYGTKQTLNNIKINNKYIIYTKLIFRETDLDLYGFYDNNELYCFNMLIKVSGVGPKVALNILSYDKYNNIYCAIVDENIKYLIAISGVGIKMAQRIIIELKDRINKKNYKLHNENNNIEDIINVLLNLGYKKNDIINGIKNIKNINELSDENIIKEMLVILK